MCRESIWANLSTRDLRALETATRKLAEVTRRNQKRYNLQAIEMRRELRRRAAK